MKQRSLVEFIVLMAVMMSLVALCIDGMLPALGEIGADLHVSHENDAQLVISILFIGMALGQIFYGPLSDGWGRKPAAFLGFFLFMAGCFISLFSKDLLTMSVGRVLQGFGLAGPRVVCMALVRDLFHGNEMAKIMSFIMVIFILTPTVAPAFGQAIISFWSWRAIFVGFLVIGTIIMTWFGLRQPETLLEENKLPFSLNRVGRAFLEVISHKAALGYTLAAGFISSAFLGYLSLAQPVFQVQYGLGSRFPLVFGALAASIGLASFVNGRMVLRFGMQNMALKSCSLSALLSILFLGVAWFASGQPPLWALLVYLFLNLFCLGVLFGNMNALAMEPLGHIAGTGAAVVGSISTLLAVPFGVAIGRSYHHSVVPLIAGFAIFTTLAAGTMAWIQKSEAPKEP